GGVPLVPAVGRHHRGSQRQGPLPSHDGELLRPDHREHPHPALCCEQPDCRGRDGGAHRGAGHAGRLRPGPHPLAVPRVRRTVRSLLVPVVVPCVATQMLYAFLFASTEFIGAHTFITDISKPTLPVALLNVETSTFGQVNFGFLIAGAEIAMVPCAVLYVALQ